MKFIRLHASVSAGQGPGDCGHGMQVALTTGVGGKFVLVPGEEEHWVACPPYQRNP